MRRHQVVLLASCSAFILMCSLSEHHTVPSDVGSDLAMLEVRMLDHFNSKKFPEHGEMISVQEGADELRIWFGYAKEELSCFRGGILEKLIGSQESVGLLMQADMVVLLELARRPSAADMERDNRTVSFDMQSCEEFGGVGLDVQLSQKLGGSKAFVQVHQYAEDDPTEVDQALLSVWYDPGLFKPGKALAYKNKFGAKPAECRIVQLAKTGFVNVTRDAPVGACPQSHIWPYYDSSKASLVTSWLPKSGVQPFAIWGANLPASHYKGKNHMVQRVAEDIAGELDVPRGRIFILGDMNTRLLPGAWDVCQEAYCQQPASFRKQLELSNQAWETIPNRSEEQGDVGPCCNVSGARGGYSSTGACREALEARASCRRACMARLGCNASLLERAASRWRLLDTKRGAGGLDLLPRYFAYPPDRTLEAGARGPRLGHWRRPTYKRAMDGDLDPCIADAPFFGTCAANPCSTAHGRQAVCSEAGGKCFERAVRTKSDVITPSDPATSHRGERMVQVEMGWLDAFGFSKELRPSLSLLMYEDRPALTFGDHVPIVAAVALAP